MKKYILIIALSLLGVSCKTVNIYVISGDKLSGDIEILIEQTGSDIDSKLKAALQ